MQLGTRVYTSEASREVYWILYEGCQCEWPYDHDFSVQDGYFTCIASDYVIFRAKLSLSYESSNYTMELASLKASLFNFLTREDGKTHITLSGRRYSIEPGPCGLTVPHVNFSHCHNSTPTQQASAAVYTSPQDNTVTTIVAIMSTSLVLVVLGGCIVFLVIELRKT